MKRENINLEYCPTEEMIGDFYTKPLQGSLFRKMRAFIMGHSDTLNEERVENNAFYDVNETRVKGLDSRHDSNIKNESEIKDEISYADIVKGKMK